MADDQKLSLTVQVNAETGELEVVGQQLAGLGNKAKSLSSEAESLFRSFLPFATAGAILAFFSEGVKGAEMESQALQRLKFAVEASGESWDKNQQSILDWSGAIQQATRFSDGQALGALDRLARVTGNYKQAQSAATLAINLSVKTGKDLAETTQFVSDLITKQERAVRTAHKEYGIYAGVSNNVNDILKDLTRTTADAAIGEESLTKTQAQTTHAFEEFGEQIGRTITPAVAGITKGLTLLIKVVDNIGTSLAAMVKVNLTALVGMFETLKAAFSGNFIQARRAALQTLSNMKADVIATVDEMGATWQAGTDKQVQIAQTGAQQKLHASVALNESEIRARAEQAAKIQDFEAEIARNLGELENDEYKKKRNLLEAEVAIRRQKITREITDERQKNMLLAKLEDEHAKRIEFYQKEESRVRRLVALDSVDTALQALSIVNDASKQDTDAQVLRAKAILALEKSIAIARILSSPQAVLNPGLAAAQVALTVAQFGQQLNAIDSARSAFHSGSDRLAVTTPLPGGGSFTEIGSGGGGGPGFAPLTGAGGRAAGGNSFGGSQIILNINAGAIIINGSVGIDDIATRIGEKLIEQIKGQGQLGLTGGS